MTVASSNDRARTTATIAVFFAVATGLCAVVPHFFASVPPAMSLALTSAVAIIGVATAALNVWSHGSPKPSYPPPVDRSAFGGPRPSYPPPGYRPIGPAGMKPSRGLSGPWIGATLTMLGLSLILPPMAVFLLLTIPMALRLYRVAAGVAVALMVTVVVLVALAWVMLSVDSGTNPYGCVPQGYSTSCY